MSETLCKCGSGKPAAFKCRWKFVRPFMIWAKDLREGDSMQIPFKIGYSQVVVITPGLTAGWLHIKLAVMPTPGAYYTISPGTPVMVQRPGHCEAPCCEDCGRDVNPDGRDHRYCKAHWDAWERPESIDQREEVEA